MWTRAQADKNRAAVQSKNDILRFLNLCDCQRYIQDEGIKIEKEQVRLLSEEGTNKINAPYKIKGVLNVNKSQKVQVKSEYPSTNQHSQLPYMWNNSKQRKETQTVTQQRKCLLKSKKQYREVAKL